MSEQGKKQPSLLFTPLTIRGVTLKNRIGVSPMATWKAVDGIPNDYHVMHYGSFAQGGAGLVMVEATAVEPRGRMTPAETCIYNDEQVEGWRRVTALIKSLGSVSAIQIFHVGRKGSVPANWKDFNQSYLSDDQGGWPVIAPSAIRFNDKHRVPKEATLEDIEVLQQAFVSAALRAVSAGFEVIELHYAHGYLVNQWLSPACNQRTDRYGGSLENRMRFGLETARRVREVIPKSMPLFVRISV
ncbi:unnamed protein product, partial [Medioppia subpectinata]